MRVGGFRRGNHLLFRGVGAGIEQVFADCCGEEKRFLQHDAHAGAQVIDFDIAYIDAVNRNAAVADIIEAAQQVDQRGFACAGRSDDGDHLSGLAS